MVIFLPLIFFYSCFFSPFTFQYGYILTHIHPAVSFLITVFTFQYGYILTVIRIKRCCCKRMLYIPIWLYSYLLLLLGLFFIFLPLHSNMVIFLLGCKQRYISCRNLYIPIWLYSYEYLYTLTLLVKLLYIPIWLYSYGVADPSIWDASSFTFQYGYILTINSQPFFVTR